MGRNSPAEAEGRNRRRVREERRRSTNDTADEPGAEMRGWLGEASPEMSADADEEEEEETPNSRFSQLPCGTVAPRSTPRWSRVTRAPPGVAVDGPHAVEPSDAP